MIYWKSIFEEFGYEGIDLIRPVFWNDTDVKPWYRNNMLIYVKKDSLIFQELQKKEVKYIEQYDMINPDLYLLMSEQYNQYRLNEPIRVTKSLYITREFYNKLSKTLIYRFVKRIRKG